MCRAESCTSRRRRLGDRCKTRFRCQRTSGAKLEFYIGPHNLLNAYRLLLRHYGHQHWWPIYRATSPSRQPQATSRNQIHPDPVEGRLGGVVLQRCPCPKRLTEADRFQICVGAILTQNTAWTNVERAFAAIMRAAPSRKPQAASPWSPRWIVSLPRAELARLIRPAGYFNQKARKLQIFSRWLLAQHDGSLAKFFRLSTDDCRLQLLALWGIGPETADSILLYAGRHPVFVIDAYTKRWLETKMSKAELRTYDEYQRFFMDRLPRDARLFSEFHALIVAWGKTNRRTSVH